MSKRIFDTNVNIAEINEKQYAINTDYIDKTNEKSLKSFISDKGYSKGLNELTKTELDDVLQEFFVSVRQKDGSKYQKQSLDSIRYSINRVLKKIYGPEQCDIIKDPAFAKSRDTYKNYCKTLKAEGKNVVSHYDQVPPETLAHIVQTLNPNTPIQLQNLLWLYIMLFFCRRGSENIHLMTKKTFKVMTTEKGRRYLKQVVDEETKNHKWDSNESIGGRMFEISGSERCPIVLYEKMIQKLHPECNRLWQRAKDSFNDDEATWYQNRPLGVHMISKFMANICNLCNITIPYTNHCLRVSAINIMKNNFSDADIMSITGHKSINSLKLYERTTEKDKEDISDCISSKLVSKTCLKPILVNDHQAPSTSANFQQLEMDDEFNEIMKELNFDQLTQSYVSESMTVKGPPNKKMRIKADGENNCVEIFFD